MGQRADRQVVDARARHLTRPVEREVPGGLQLDAAHLRLARPDRLDDLAQQRGRHVVEQEEPRTGRERLERLVERVSLDLDHDVREPRPYRGDGGRDRARRHDVVVLDHRDVVQAHALVRAAAAAHGVLLERAQARGRLAGVQHACARALERVGPSSGVRRDTRRARREVEQRPLRDEQHLDRSGKDCHDVIACYA